MAIGSKTTKYISDMSTGLSTQSGSSVQTDYNDMLNKLNQKTLSNPTAASRKASSIVSATNALKRANAQAAAYQSQLDTLNATAADAKQENWIRYMKALKALPQQMANNGINGGTTESSLVRLNASYGSANNEVDKEILPDRTNLRAQVKAAQEIAAAAKKRMESVGNDSYITNAYGNILNNVQQMELNTIIQGMAAEGYTDVQIQSALQKAGF